MHNVGSMCRVPRVSVHNDMIRVQGTTEVKCIRAHFTGSLCADAKCEVRLQVYCAEKQGEKGNRAQNAKNVVLLCSENAIVHSKTVVAEFICTDT